MPVAAASSGRGVVHGLRGVVAGQEVVPLLLPGGVVAEDGNERRGGSLGPVAGGQGVHELGAGLVGADVGDAQRLGVEGRGTELGEFVDGAGLLLGDLAGEGVGRAGFGENRVHGC